MAKITAVRVWTKLGAGAVTLLATCAALIGVGSATAHADDIGADPRVSSRQATEGSGSVRPDATQGDVRSAEILDVHANGEVKQSMKAVPTNPQGTRAGSFQGAWHDRIRGGMNKGF